MNASGVFDVWHFPNNLFSTHSNPYFVRQQQNTQQSFIVSIWTEKTHDSVFVFKYDEKSDGLHHYHSISVFAKNHID